MNDPAGGTAPPRVLQFPTPEDLGDESVYGGFSMPVRWGDTLTERRKVERTVLGFVETILEEAETSEAEGRRFPRNGSQRSFFGALAQDVAAHWPPARRPSMVQRYVERFGNAPGNRGR